MLAVVPALALSGVLIGAAPARAASISTNWAGYVVQRHSGAGFTRVVGAWIQPAVPCNRGRDGYAAFWVGLGGYKRTSTKLEQIGTEVQCNLAGQATYRAWYEILPAAPVPLSLAVNPGDTIAASVTKTQRGVTLHLRDLTSGHWYAHHASVNAPDTSSAEWIAEAPAGCDRRGCQPLPLTDFGTMAFLGTRATAAGHTAPIADPRWTADAIELQGESVALGGSDAPALVAISPGPLQRSGSEFTVTWHELLALPPPPEPTQVADLPARPSLVPPAREP